MSYSTVFVYVINDVPFLLQVVLYGSLYEVTLACDDIKSIVKSLTRFYVTRA